jgi:hypothetical protein
VPLFLVPLGVCTSPAVGSSDEMRLFFSDHSKKSVYVYIVWFYIFVHTVFRIIKKNGNHVVPAGGL